MAPSVTKKPSQLAKTSKKSQKGAPKKGKDKKETAEVKALRAKVATMEAALLVKRNADFLDEEEAPRPAKRRPLAPPSDDELPFGADDAAGLDLGPKRVPSSTQTSPTGSDQEDALNQSQDGDDNDDDEKSTKSQGGTPSPDDSDDMVVDDVLPKTQKGGRSRKPRNSNSSAGSSKSSTKVVQADFSPQSLRLANKGRSAVRVSIATESGFPDEEVEWTWETLKKTVASINDQQLAERLDMAVNDTGRRSKLVSYAWGGAAQLRGEVKTLCKAAVSLFGIPGNHSNQEIVDIIKWLTSKKGIFKFGGVDIAARTYDTQKPYGHPFYQDVITKQFFSSPVAEGVRSISYEQFIDLNIPVFTIVTDGMENALKEYASGVRINIKFTKEEYGPRYDHHRLALESLQQKSPLWFAAFSRGLYSQIVQHTSFAHLKTAVAEQEDDELAGVDFAALEASVSAAGPA